MNCNLRSSREIKPDASDSDRSARAKSVTRGKSGERVFSLSCVSALSRASYSRSRRAPATQATDRLCSLVPEYG